MNLAYLTPEVLATFERDYPRAYHFVLQATLRQEYAALGRIPRWTRLPAEAARYDELHALLTEVDGRMADQLTLLPPWAAAGMGN